jgi:hypothetical protein
MEKKIRIYAHYNQFSSRYSEDTWDMDQIVENEDDVFEFMKSCHLQDARHRNNYPITSHWKRWVKFYAEEYIVVDGKQYFSKEKVNIDPPAYYESAKQRYADWEVRLKDVLERREAQKVKIRKEENDRFEFERLKLKYNS